MSNLQQPDPPSNAAACLIVRLSPNRELCISPESVRESGDAYRLALRRREHGRTNFVGCLLLTRPEIVELIKALQGLPGE